MATKILHLDAALGVTVDGSNLVSQWNDQSGNNYHVVQATPTNKPLLVANQLNGKPVIRFDGTNDYLNKSFGIPYSQKITMFCVIKNNSSNRIIFDGFDATARVGFSLGATNIITTFAPNYVYGSTTTLGNFNLFSAVFNGTLSYIRTNRVNTNNSTNIGSLQFKGITLGVDCYKSVGYFLNGDIAELIFYSSITDSEANDVEQMLNAKYALGLDSNIDFITLEEEQLYSPRLDEALVDFVTLEEEQLPLAIPEELQEFSVTEQDLDFTTLEIILDESVDRSDPVTTDITLVESLDPFTIPVPVKRMVHGGSRAVLCKLI